jgi:predicted MFS family arabinose efflux permease
MVFVSAISVIAALGIAVSLKNIPMPPAISLKQRLAPFANHRIGLTFLTTLFVQCGSFTMYTYFSVIFDRVTYGDPLIFGLLLVLWGFSGTIMNLVGGRLIDTIGTRKVLVAVLLALMAVTATLSWTSAILVTAIIAIMIHGATSWGQLAALSTGLFRSCRRPRRSCWASIHRPPTLELSLPVSSALRV